MSDKPSLKIFVSAIDLQEPSQAFTMKLFHENSYWLKAIN